MRAIGGPPLLLFLLILFAPSRLAFGLREAAAQVDSRGPISNLAMRVTASPGSVQAPDYQFKNGCEKPESWNARWIWLNRTQDINSHQPVAAMFRKKITLDRVPLKARFWVSADVIYRLYVNGKLVARGPADIGRDYDREMRGPQWLYDYRDLTGALHTGVNVIAAEVFTDGFVSSRVTRGKHGLLLEAKLDFESGPSQTIATDETWRGAADSAWTNTEEWDASRESIGWRLPEFDDSGWSNCSSIKSVWTPLAASELPPLMEARYPLISVHADPLHNTTSGLKSRFSPITVAVPSVVTLTYDRVIAAYPSFKIDGGAGAVLRIVPGERAGQQSRVVTLHLRDGVQTFDYPFLDSFSVLRLEFSSISGTKAVKILDAGANFTSFPLRYAGSFECGDSHLNDLWATSRWLTQICMQTHHLDSPNHQEPICDPGDYLIESTANYYAFGSPWLARQDLRKFGRLLKDLNYRNFHTSYSLLWLQMLMNYYDYTGDAGLVKELAPEVHGLLDTFTAWRGSNGLISEAPNYMFMDWVTISGFGCHHPPAVIGQGYMTAFYYRALADGIRVASLMKDRSRVAAYRSLRISVADAFNRELWSASNGLYRDGKPHQTSVKPSEWLPADTEIETFSPHVNTLAVLYDLAPAERREAIMGKLMENRPLNCQPYFMYFVLEALAHTSQFAHYGPDLLNRWKIDPNTQTFHEMWTDGDMSHAWGSAPLIQMSGTVLGVRPLTPGFDRISIRPTIFGLSWAKGTVPTPHGPLAVSWRASGGKFSIDVSVPPGAIAEVLLPESANNLNRPLIWRAGTHSSSMRLAQ